MGSWSLLRRDSIVASREHRPHPDMKGYRLEEMGKMCGSGMPRSEEHTAASLPGCEVAWASPTRKAENTRFYCYVPWIWRRPLGHVLHIDLYWAQLGLQCATLDPSCAIGHKLGPSWSQAGPSWAQVVAMLTTVDPRLSLCCRELAHVGSKRWIWTTLCRHTLLKMYQWLFRPSYSTTKLPAPSARADFLEHPGNSNNCMQGRGANFLYNFLLTKPFDGEANLALKRRSCAYQRCWRCHQGWPLIRATFHWPCTVPIPSPAVGGNSRKKVLGSGAGNLWTPATAVKSRWLLPGPCVTGLCKFTVHFCQNRFALNGHLQTMW